MSEALVGRVVIIVQENHTTDNYFRSMAAYGANVAADWPISPNPPRGDHPHDRHAYFRWLTHKSSTVQHLQFDTSTVLPFYAYLATTGAFFENHCSGFGTNSTPNHLLIIGGQSPTLRNPPRGTSPQWDMPSLPGLAADNRVGCKCYTGTDGYPFRFYTQLAQSRSIVSTEQFVGDARSGNLPPLAFLYHQSPLDEHPAADVTKGMGEVWRAVDAVVQGGEWESTVFIQTWDDWGGYDDHVGTPVVEYTPDNVQLAYGPRVPLLMFGGRVRGGIDSRWCSHVTIPRTAIQLLGLPDIGVPRVDEDPGLADRVAVDVNNPPPPAFGTQVLIPPAPDPTPPLNPLPHPPVTIPTLVAEVVLRDGSKLPPPNDVQLPKQPAPPTNG